MERTNASDHGESLEYTEKYHKLWPTVVPYNLKSNALSKGGLKDIVELA